MNKAKYIVWNDGFPQAVIFSDTINHSDIAKALRMVNVVGAGFCRTADDLYICYGNSISLKKSSRGPKDEAILNKCFAGVES